MGVFTSDASFTKIVQPAPQEDSSATAALSTSGIHQDPCSTVLQLQMHLWVVPVGIVAKRTLEAKIAKLANVVIQYDKWHLPAAQILITFWQLTFKKAMENAMV